MTLERRVRAVEALRGGREREPREMTNAELWLEVLDCLGHADGAEVQQARAHLRGVIAAGGYVAPDWGEALLRRLSPHDLRAEG